jgi:hypothetical protein
MKKFFWCAIAAVSVLLRVSAISFAQTPKPDLKVMAASCAGATFCQQATCVVTVKNVGTVDVQHIYFNITSSTTTTTAGCLGLTSFPSAIYNGFLPPEQSVEVNVSFLPRVAGHQQFTVTAWAPTSGGTLSIQPDLSNDANPADNTMNFPLTVAPPPPCDLQVISLQCANAVGGVQTPCVIQVKNNGPGKATQIGVKLELIGDQPPASSPVPVFTPFPNSTIYSLDPNATQDASLNFTFPEAGAIPVKATAYLSPDNAIVDSNPANNSLEANVEVALPPPVVAEVAPASAKAGDKIIIKGKWFTKRGNQPPPAVRIGNVSATASGATPNHVAAATPCLSKAASVHVMVQTAAGLDSSKSLKYTTLPLAITSVSTTSPKPGQTGVIIHLNNANVFCTMTVRLQTQTLPVVNQSCGGAACKLVVNIPKNMPSGRAVLSVENAGAKAETTLTILPL